MNGVQLFWRDLGKAVRAWAAAPALPIVSVLVVLPLEGDVVLRAAFPGASWGAYILFVELPFLLFGIGWVGTQRIWYLRIFNGGTLSQNDLWDLSWRFFGRYFVLGVLVGTPVFALLFGVLFWQIRVGAVHSTQPTWLLITFVIYWFVVDVVLTFVTPALAYTTARVRQAWMIGLSMLRETWPSCAVYALLPPLTLLALGTINPAGFRAEVAVTVSVVSTLIGLATKGAIASFYLEKVPVSGAASAPVR
ncbi:MAG TPA: hypothetical protein VHO95_10320 [Candidatus Dormibacteraeota bacterium]|nr:hypothetical protein [Candidatus Dormibacteraeota bacterium]